MSSVKAIQEADCYLRQGMTESLHIEWRDSDGNLMSPLDEWTARLMVRESPESEEILLDCTTENSRIILEDTGFGMINIYLTALETSELNFNTAEHQLEMYYEDYVVRLVAGVMTLLKEVVR